MDKFKVVMNYAIHVYLLESVPRLALWAFAGEAWTIA